MSRNTKHEVVNIAKWKPLIDLNKQLVPYILSIPFDGKSKNQCKSVNIDEITEIEDDLDELRKINQNKFNIKKEDLIKENLIKNKLTPVLLAYKDGTDYKDTFLNLMKLERSSEKSRRDDDDSLGSMVVFKRITEALEIFEKNQKGINGVIYDAILGRKIPEDQHNDFSMAGYNGLKLPDELPDINESQKNAIIYALNNPLTLIQGNSNKNSNFKLFLLI